MRTFLINTPLGYAVIEQETPVEALVEYLTEEIGLRDLFLDRDDLLKRGYKAIKTTAIKNVYELLK